MCKFVRFLFFLDLLFNLVLFVEAEFKIRLVGEGPALLLLRSGQGP